VQRLVTPFLVALERVNKSHVRSLCTLTRQWLYITFTGSEPDWLPALPPPFDRSGGGDYGYVEYNPDDPTTFPDDMPINPEVHPELAAQRGFLQADGL
jgi:hypothetical protein